MNEVILTKISDHGKTSSGSSCPNGATIGRTQKGWSMWTLAYGTGANRKSKTMHCSAAEAEAEKNRLKGDK